MNIEKIEFTQKQIDRIDDVYNTVYDCIRSITNLTTDKEIEWDMAVIGPITENIINSLLESGTVDKIYFPTRIEDGDNVYIEDYYTIK